jgi:hypothetical protein
VTALPPAVLWADPGGLTGLAYFYPGNLRPDLRFTAREHPFREACDAVRVFCEVHGPRAAVGWERYTPNPKVPQDHAADALEVIGILRYFSSACGCRVLPPAAPHTPVPAEQARLKALGWWVPGQKDSQSAACHLLRWLMSSGLLPPAEAEVLAAARAAR